MGNVVLTGEELTRAIAEYAARVYGLCGDIEVHLRAYNDPKTSIDKPPSGVFTATVRVKDTIHD